MYLTHEAFVATLRGLRTLVPREGTVVFDYGLSPSLLTWRQRAAFEVLAGRVSSAGEPWLTFFEPESLAATLRSEGCASIVDVGADEINARYFAGRADGLRIGGLARLMKAGW